MTSVRTAVCLCYLQANINLELIKGFAANAPAEVLNSVQAWGTEYDANIEEDQTVHTLDGSS